MIYGTSEIEGGDEVSQLLLDKDVDKVALQRAGLEKENRTTRFDFRNVKVVPFTDVFFEPESYLAGNIRAGVGKIYPPIVARYESALTSSGLDKVLETLKAQHNLIWPSEDCLPSGVERQAAQAGASMPPPRPD